MNDTDEELRIQKRIDAEDALLHGRTTIFLVTNGLLFAALGIEAYGNLCLVFALLGILVTAVWILAGWQSWRIIRQWHIEREKRYPESLEVIVAKNALSKPGWIRPTDLLARWLPRIFLLVWILGVVILIQKP